MIVSILWKNHRVKLDLSAINSLCIGCCMILLFFFFSARGRIDRFSGRFASDAWMAPAFSRPPPPPSLRSPPSASVSDGSIRVMSNDCVMAETAHRPPPRPF